MPVNTQALMRQYDELAADNARLLNEIKELRDEIELWKDRCAAERQAHEATINHHENACG